MRRNIEAERGRKRMTQKEVAEAIGVSPRTYSRYIEGGFIPSDKLQALAQLFDCTMEELLHEIR